MCGSLFLFKERVMSLSRHYVLSLTIFVHLFLWSSLALGQAVDGPFELVEPTEVAPEVDSEASDLLWITFVLIDQDAPRERHSITGRYEPSPVREAWVTSCQPESPTFVGESLPIGWESPQPGTEIRHLDAVTCERYLDLSVNGIIGGHHFQDRLIRWQPGPNGKYQVGIPREDTHSFEVFFPSIITTDIWVYAAEVPVKIHPTQGVQELVIEVPLRRYARLILRRQGGAEGNIKELVSTEGIERNHNDFFLRSGMHALRAPTGYLFTVVDLKPDQRTPGESFPRGTIHNHLEVHLQRGWTYVLNLRRQPGQRLSVR